MSLEFGMFLKRLRRERGLSREKLAQAGGVSVRAITYWEVGSHSPGVAEWQHVMAAIGATAEERAQGAALLTTPRGLRIARQETQAASADSAGNDLYGSLPDLGELLRSLRMRRGWTQTQVARQLGVGRVSVNRWESTSQLPSDDNLDRLCALLNAAPEEKLALQRRRLEPPHWGPELSWDGCVEQVEILWRTQTIVPLAELTMLAVKRQVQLHLGRHSDAPDRLAVIESLYATLLWYQERDGESFVHTQRSLAMLGDVFPGDPIHYGILNLAAVLMNRTGGKRESGLKLFERWLPRLKVDAYQIILLCDMALFHGGRKRFVERDALLGQVRRLLQTSPNAMPYHHDYFGTTYGSILKSAGKPVEAMAYLPHIDDEATAPRATLTQWAEVLIEAGDRQTATRYLNLAAHQLKANPNPRAQKEWDVLTRLLS